MLGSSTAALSLSPSPSAQPSGHYPPAAGSCLSKYTLLTLPHKADIPLPPSLLQPRTAKKVVLFVGQRDSSTGRWTFGLNPALSWAADVSLDTKLRLRDLPAEAQAAFARKYPARQPGDWCLKSQKYKPPGSSQTYQVPLEQLVRKLRQQEHNSVLSPLGQVAAGAAGLIVQGSGGG